MLQLIARLSLSRVSEAGVHVARGSSAEGGGCGRLGGFFTVITLDGGVVGLAGYLGYGIGFESAVSWCRAWRKGFGVEFGGGVVSD